MARAILSANWLSHLVYIVKHWSVMNDILDTSEIPEIAGLKWIGTDEALSKLIAEFAAARLEFGTIDKDREGQYGNQRFKYSPLGTLTEATAKPLARHGIVVMQHITNSPVEGKHRLHMTIAGHGARIVSSLDFAPSQAKEEGQYKGEWIKEYGKLCTYLCRYQYKTTMVLDSEPDADDADETPQAPPKRREAPTPPQARQERREPAPRQQEQRRGDPASQTMAEPPKQTQLAVVPPPTKTDPLAEKLSTPVNTDTATAVPGTPEPRVEREDADPPASQELQNEFLAVFRTAGMTKIQFGQFCLDTVGVPATELRDSTAKMQRVLELLKKRVAGAA
jgi:hypothetical protein